MGTLSDSISFSFDSVLSKMRELQKKLNYTLTDQQLQENAQSYIDKSQAYKFYQGEVTEKKLKAWLQNSIKYLQEKPKTNKTAEHKMDWEEVAEHLPERLQRIRELEEKYDREYSEPVEADYQIIDGLEDKNASA
jgi:thiaminase